ncbi:MAG: hypothetical protein AB3N16_01905 [Flavobacteriaceae bacterium]
MKAFLSCIAGLRNEKKTKNGYKRWICSEFWELKTSSIYDKTDYAADVHWRTEVTYQYQ